MEQVCPFTTLTRRGQLHRLLALARQVLAEYDLPTPRVNYLLHATNLHFKVQAADGQRYILRISADNDTTLQENRIEIFWLRDLNREGRVSVVQPLPRRDGEYISLAQVEGDDLLRRCVLFRWVPGRTLDGKVTPANFHDLGQLMAGLHNHAVGLTLPSTMQPKRWDRVFYFNDERAIYHLPQYSTLITPSRKDLLDEAISICDPLLASLYSPGRQAILIHGDLHIWNVHRHQGRLTALDFDDITFGFPEQDIAISLFYAFTRPDYPDLLAAFREGYTNLRPWPSVPNALLAGLMAARQVNFINYVLDREDDPSAMLERMFSCLQSMLAAYQEGR